MFSLLISVLFVCLFLFPSFVFVLFCFNVLSSLLFLLCLTSIELCRCIIEPDVVETLILGIVADDVGAGRRPDSTVAAAR